MGFTREAESPCPRVEGPTPQLATKRSLVPSVLFFLLGGGCSLIHSNVGFYKETGSRREAAASGSPPHAQQSRTTLFTTLSMRQQLRPPFRWPQLSHARCCACVFSKTMYLDRQRYTVFWPYTVCRPHTKTKITRTHAHTRRLFFWDVAIRNSLRSNKTSYHRAYVLNFVRLPAKSTWP